MDIIVMADSLDDPLMAGVTSSPAPSDSTSSSNLDVSVDDSCLEMVHFSNKDQDVEAQKFFNEDFEMSVKNVEPQLLVVASSLQQLANSQPPRPGQNSFYGSQNDQDSKVEPAQKHGPPSAREPAVNDDNIWTRNEPENNESLRHMLQKKAISQNQSDSEVMIGSISVPVKNCTQHQQGNNLEEAQDDSGNEQDSVSKYTANRGRQDQEEGVLVKDDDLTLSSQTFQQSHSTDNVNNEYHSCLPPEGNSRAEGLSACASLARAFLAQSMF